MRASEPWRKGFPVRGGLLCGRILGLWVALLLLTGCTQVDAGGQQPQVSVELPPGAQLLDAPTPGPLSASNDRGASEPLPEAGPPPAVLPAGQDAISVAAAPPLNPSLDGSAPQAPTRVEIPAIRVDSPVIPVGWRAVRLADGQVVSVWEVADYAVGWHKNSALPGQGENIVLSGHNNIKGAVFRKLYTLEPGDEITVWVGNRSYRYRVDQVMILPERDAPPEQRRANARWIQPFGEERLTLVSCWPEDDNSHRVIVVAFPVP